MSSRRDILPLFFSERYKPEHIICSWLYLPDVEFEYYKDFGNYYLLFSQKIYDTNERIVVLLLKSRDINRCWGALASMQLHSKSSATERFLVEHWWSRDFNIPDFKEGELIKLLENEIDKIDIIQIEDIFVSGDSEFKKLGGKEGKYTKGVR